jgi:hypothetical protein
MPPARALLLALFLAAFGLSYTGPITEGDYFWHLAVGKAVLGGGAVPLGEFPTQWLGQAALYAIWEAAGYGGMVLMRAAVYTAVLLGLFLWMKREGVRFYVALFFLLFPARLLLSFPSERPQIFTFALFPITVYLLEGFRKRDRPGNIWVLVPLFALWANLHGGVLAGALCLFIYFAGEAVCFVKKKSSLRKLLSIAAIAAAPPLLVLAVRPGAVVAMAEVAKGIFAPGAYMASVVEYLPPHEAARGLGLYFPEYWAFLALAAFTLASGRRGMPVHHALMVLAFAALSLRFLRFMPFLLFLAPLVAKHGPWRKRYWEGGRALYAGFAAVLVAWAVFTPMRPRLGVSGDFPKDSASFIERLLPSGRIFSYQGWSGYLAWELPGRDLFMPVEGVTEELDSAYEAVIWADKTDVMGRPQWRSLLDAYGIDIVVMPALSPVSGEYFPIIDSLFADGGWFLVHSDEVSNIFVRGVPGNYSAISLYSLPKANVFEQAVSQARRQLGEDPDNKVLLRSLGNAYKNLGRQKEADEAYREAGRG